MEKDGKLIDITSEPTRSYLGELLRDRTTGGNIVWATDSYADRGEGFRAGDEMTVENLLKDPELVKPRAEKSREARAARVRKNGEVFTPTWLCKSMNDFCDADWADPENAEFHDPDDATTIGAIAFPPDRKWKDYVKSRRLEVACGEAPFLATRYDAATGKPLSPSRRVGILDRKLRVVCGNAKTESEWRKWALRACEATYGYEYQGDSLLIARINLLLTVVDYYPRYNRKVYPKLRNDPPSKFLSAIVDRIVWNVFQMDGLKEPPIKLLFEGASKDKPPLASCKIKDWSPNSRKEGKIEGKSGKIEF